MSHFIIRQQFGSGAFTQMAWHHLGQRVELRIVSSRQRAALAAFAPIKGLVQGKGATVGLAYRVATNVAGALFSGIHFLLLVSNIVDRLDQLHASMLRSLRGAPRWFSYTLLRADIDIGMTWGEQLVFRALCFRAQLWMCPTTMLVCKVWRECQSFEGRSFSNVSRQLMIDLDLPEIYERHSWEFVESDGLSVLDNYKHFQKTELERRSAFSWRQRAANLRGLPLYILSQLGPSRITLRFSQVEVQELAFDMDMWSSLRIGLQQVCTKDNPKLCSLCGSERSGRAHLCKDCPMLSTRPCVCHRRTHAAVAKPECR